MVERFRVLATAGFFFHIKLALLSPFVPLHRGGQHGLSLGAGHGSQEGYIPREEMHKPSRQYRLRLANFDHYLGKDEVEAEKKRRKIMAAALQDAAPGRRRGTFVDDPTKSRYST
jgi:hypothetical protein